MTKQEIKTKNGYAEKCIICGKNPPVGESRCKRCRGGVCSARCGMVHAERRVCIGMIEIKEITK